MDAMLAMVPTSAAGALALIELVLNDVEGEMTTLGRHVRSRRCRGCIAEVDSGFS